MFFLLLERNKMEMDYEMSADSATTMKFSKGEGKDPQILLPKQV